MAEEQARPSGAAAAKGPEPKQPDRSGKGFAVGMLVGVTLAGVFNPVDKALYLMILKRRPFLTPANWARPFEGLSQALVVRTLSGGTFYPMFDLWVDNLRWAGLNHSLNMVAGQLTGATIALFMSPMNAVKYEMWGHTDKTVRATISDMYKSRGMAAFVRGMHVTVGRDTVFGGVYAGSRLALQSRTGKPGEKPPLSLNLCAASAAVALSSPLNYARNMQFGAAEGTVSPSVPAALQQLAREVRAENCRGGAGVAVSFLQRRLGLGWGTLRVGVGMAMGQQLYDIAMSSV